MGVAGSCWRLYIQPAPGSTPGTPKTSVIQNTPKATLFYRGILKNLTFKLGHYLVTCHQYW